MSGCNEVLNWDSSHGSLQVRMRIAGGGPGPVALFIHGTASSGRIWDGLVTRLPEGTYVAPDTPGMGDSPASLSWDVSFADWLDFFGRVGEGAASVSKDGKCHLVGHSLGGAIAAHLAREEWVGTVSLISPATGSYCRCRLALDRGPREGTILLPGPLENLAHDPRSIGRETAAVLREDYGKARQLLERGLPWPPYREDEGLLLQGKNVLLVWGDDDRVIAPAFFERLRDRLAPSKAVLETAVLRGCGHVPMLEQPSELAGRLAAFWSAPLGQTPD